MKIIFDNLIFSIQRGGGISLYWSEILKRGKHLKSLQASSRSIENIFAPDDKLAAGCMLYYSWPVWFERVRLFNGLQSEAAVFHSSYYRVSRSKKHVSIVTVHDFTHELVLRKTFRRRVLSAIKRRAIRKAHGIICVSRNTMSDLMRLHPYLDPARVSVIYNGKQEPISDNNERQLPVFLTLQPYFLFVGSRAEYKNALHCFMLLREIPDLMLVLVGGEELSKSELTFLGDDVRRVYAAGSVSQDELELFYKNAQFLFHPSEYEGFGITVVEAQAVGCPVIAKNCSSIPEVAGDAALLYSDFQKDLSQVLKYVNELHHDEFRRDIRRKGLENASRFSWDKCARETFLFYQYIYDSVVRTDNN